MVVVDIEVAETEDGHGTGGGVGCMTRNFHT